MTGMNGASEALRLPAGWELLRTDAGRPYFWNRKTNQTSWQSPIPIQAEAEEAPDTGLAAFGYPSRHLDLRYAQGGGCFLVERMPADHSCGFHGLGVDRQTAAALLLDNLHDAEVQEFLTRDLQAALQTGERRSFPAALRREEHLWGLLEELYSQQQALDHKRREAKALMADVGASPAVQAQARQGMAAAMRGFFNELKEKAAKQSGSKLTTLQLMAQCKSQERELQRLEAAAAEAQQNLRSGCRAHLRAYVSWVGSDFSFWLSFLRPGGGDRGGGLLDAIAKVAGLTVRVWAEDAQRSLALLHTARFGGREVDLWYQGDLGHFDRLVPFKGEAHGLDRAAAREQEKWRVLPGVNHYEPKPETFTSFGDPTGCSLNILQLKGRRSLFVNEVEAGVKLRSGMLKDLRDQTAFIEARGLYRDPIQFKPQFILNMSANESFEFRTIDGGMRRSFTSIPWPLKFIMNTNEPLIFKTGAYIPLSGVSAEVSVSFQGSLQGPCAFWIEGKGISGTMNVLDEVPSAPYVWKGVPEGSHRIHLVLLKSGEEKPQTPEDLAQRVVERREAVDVVVRRFEDFAPSYDFQPVENWHMLPPGLEICVDLEGGKKARIPEPWQWHVRVADQDLRSAPGSDGFLGGPQHASS
ncbi:unnamed protein product [Effrenium voratum]|nr:unnamed protein product [Effrenium voratum]